jgi:choline dehydrogenase
LINSATFDATKPPPHPISNTLVVSFKGKELRPGPVDLQAFVHRFGESAYHPSGTCRMGRDADAVVSPDGIVKGVSGLRVVDASIMPEITNGNLNAVVIMMAEKIAAKIIGA